jgi:hypothetical protein
LTKRKGGKEKKKRDAVHPNGGGTKNREAKWNCNVNRCPGMISINLLFNGLLSKVFRFFLSFFEK